MLAMQQAKPSPTNYHTMYCNDWLQVATIRMFKYLADFIKQGPGEWCTISSDGFVMFHSSAEDR